MATLVKTSPQNMSAADLLGCTKKPDGRVPIRPEIRQLSFQWWSWIAKRAGRAVSGKALQKGVQICAPFELDLENWPTQTISDICDVAHTPHLNFRV